MDKADYLVILQRGPKQSAAQMKYGYNWDQYYLDICVHDE